MSERRLVIKFDLVYILLDGFKDTFVRMDKTVRLKIRLVCMYLHIATVSFKTPLHLDCTDAL